MKLKPSILTIYSLLFLAVCIGFTLYNYEQLSEGEGWGIVGMIGLFGFGVLLFVIDIVIRNIFKNKTTVNIIGLLVSIMATVLVFYDDLFS
jgi:uncharacterized PurR-regulated membrane protein YhhQ (DUF165 family)